MRRPPALCLALTTLVACGGAQVRPAPPAGPATGPTGEWVELPWQGLSGAVDDGISVRLRARGDLLYLLVEQRLYRSDDHGEHWSERSRSALADVAPFAERLLGWSGSADAPLMVSFDDGEHWAGKPSATSGDPIWALDTPAAPPLLRVLGDHVLMTQPGRPGELLVSEEPPWTWRRATLPPGTRTIQDLGRIGTTLYACGAGGLLRSADGGRTFAAQPGPEGAEAATSCALPAFDGPLCVALARHGGARLSCQAAGATWRSADRGLYSETPANPDWSKLVGLGGGLQGGRGGDRLFLAHDGANPYGPTEPGLFETTDPVAGWTRVPALAGLQVDALSATGQAVLAVTRDARRPKRSPGLHLWRYRFR